MWRITESAYMWRFFGHVYVCRNRDCVGLSTFHFLMPSLQGALMMPGQMQKTFQRKILHLGLYQSLGQGKELDQS